VRILVDANMPEWLRRSLTELGDEVDRVDEGPRDATSRSHEQEP
jgi:hypothetical protein